MLAVATVAVASRFMKKLNFAVIQANNGAFGVLFIGSLLAIECISSGRKPYSYDGFQPYALIILGGLINSGSQNLMVITMQHSNPASVSLYRYSGLFWSLLIDIIVFRTALHHLSIIGLAVVFCANIGALLYKMHMENKQ